MELKFQSIARIRNGECKIGGRIQKIQGQGNVLRIVDVPGEVFGPGQIFVKEACLGIVNIGRVWNVVFFQACVEGKARPLGIMTGDQLQDFRRNLRIGLSGQFACLREESDCAQHHDQNQQKSIHALSPSKTARGSG